MTGDRSPKNGAIPIRESIQARLDELNENASWLPEKVGVLPCALFEEIFTGLDDPEVGRGARTSGRRSRLPSFGAISEARGIHRLDDQDPRCGAILPEVGRGLLSGEGR